MDKKLSNHLNKIINLKALDRNIYSKKKIKKYIKQRVAKGYSDLDLWDLDTYLSIILYNAIKDFAKRTNGYPGTEKFPTFESWQEYLNEIIEDFNIYFTYKAEYESSIENYNKEKIEEAYKHFDDAWNKIGKVFHRLWL